jgi:hypothetical protein
MSVASSAAGGIMSSSKLITRLGLVSAALALLSAACLPPDTRKVAYADDEDEETVVAQAGAAGLYEEGGAVPSVPTAIASTEVPKPVLPVFKKDEARKALEDAEKAYKEAQLKAEAVVKLMADSDDAGLKTRSSGLVDKTKTALDDIDQMQGDSKIK